MWSPITAESVPLSDEECTGLAKIAGAHQKLSAIVTREVNSARGAILAGGARIDAVGTIPDQIIPDVLAIIVWRYLLCFPQLSKLQTKERKAAYDEARATLKDVANGDLKLELADPNTALTLPTPVGQLQVVSHSKRRLKFNAVKGLTI